jgi:hypothetical protein
MTIYLYYLVIVVTLDANEQPFGEFRGMALTIYIYKTKTPEN